MIEKNVPYLIVKGNNDQKISVSLRDILINIKEGFKMKWAILYLHAIGDLADGKSLPEFEDEINQSTNLSIYDWEGINELSFKLEQIVEIKLIGALNPNHLKRYSNEEELFDICDYTVELIDSSHWEIHAKKIANLQYILDNLPGVINLTA